MKNVKYAVLIMVSMLLIAACSETEDASAPEDLRVYKFEAIDLENLSSEKIVASYEGGEVTGEEFAKYLALQAFLNPYAPINDEEYRLDMIYDLIVERLTGSLATELEWANEQVELIWNQISLSYEDETLQDAYEILQISEEEIKAALISLLNIETYFEQQITETEIVEFYHSVIDELTTATFTHILIGINEDKSIEGQEVRTVAEALQIANKVQQRLLAGEDMGDLVSLFSDDGGSIETNGRYENIAVAGLVPEFRKALVELELHTISDPVPTEYGYHIVKLEDLYVLPFEEVKNSLVGELIHEKYLAYFYEELPTKIIEINL
ncbi:peptidylprolyl isomerase [Anaerobacillus sp. CMMVII]|uniref:foldase protein PrsA n=1 Tax=Anaerobacillus sp. CMMVII TaxID=2755588 RepID=UPI0021B73F5F|nr:peptidylprolyl isomerase [Anaerobacillus sp. CMMVII]MCT8139308.1 peptidylprolyl isomerase [Anaerobacillus sp. CMMVII]